MLTGQRSALSVVSYTKNIKAARGAAKIRSANSGHPYVFRAENWFRQSSVSLYHFCS